jgi:uncharacterized protein
MGSNQWSERMKILVSGASGLVGSRLCSYLEAHDHEAWKLTRRPPSDGARELRWNPQTGDFDMAALEGFDAVVHLAGESIAGGRWNAARKARIRDSRSVGTRHLATALARLTAKPKVLVSASAIGIYGPRGDEPLDEAASHGDDFLASVCEAWEAAAEPAREAGIRVVHPRLGVVLSTEGGALAKMLTPFKLCLGGPLGHGRQVMSWIHIDDLTKALLHMIEDDSLEGPVNSTAPAAMSNADFSRALGKALGRPAFIPMPGFQARLLFGEMADALLLSGQRVTPKRLEASGFRFDHPELAGALSALLSR